MFEAETNLSWRITLAVSIYSDTRRISREKERKVREGKSFSSLVCLSLCRPVTFCTHPNRVIHLRHVTGERACYADAFKATTSARTWISARKWKAGTILEIWVREKLRRIQIFAMG